MYVDLKKIEITKGADGTLEEQEEKYEKVFLAKVLVGAGAAEDRPFTTPPHRYSIPFPMSLFHAPLNTPLSRSLHSPIDFTSHSPSPPMQVPIMLRSNFCSLADHSDKDLTELGEDPYDQVWWSHLCEGTSVWGVTLV